MSIKKYQMWLNYDNDREKLRFPVLPDKIKVTYKGNPVSISIDKLGEIFHRGARDAVTISFSTFFPATWDSTCIVPQSAFRHPEECHRHIQTILGDTVQTPAHFVLTGGPLTTNLYVLVTSYVVEEEGGDVGTIYYSIELKEYRTVSARKITKRGDKAKVSSSKSRVNSTSQKSGKYTVKYGDCLWNLAKKYYGNGAEYTIILEANRDVLDEAARRQGYSSSNNGNILFPGTEITIPAK